MATEVLSYLAGFGNEQQSEALPGALPEGRFSPQRCAYGLYAEKFSSTAFTAPRAENRRSWFYRLRPSVVHGEFQPREAGALMTAPLDSAAPPDPLRWDAFAVPDAPQDFVDGLVTLAANGNAHLQAGIAVHLYLANRSMQERFFGNADGELLIVPESGGLRLHTECGVLTISPGEIGVVPRGMKFRVMLMDQTARGYVCENYGMPFGLPERGPVGSDGFANDRDFLSPVAAFEDREGDFELSWKFQGGLYRAAIGHSPLDVVAWVGTSFPYKYDLARFNTMGSVSYDHPDPSIYTVLSSPSDMPGTANADFVIFPGRWMVAEDTFRPPWFHRNFMSEFMGLIHGQYDAKPRGFIPGGASLHNCMTPHGPDREAFEGGSRADLGPERMRDTLAFMFESRFVLVPTRFALECEQRQRGYRACWQDLEKQFDGEP
ncbi:MAG: homogentisate 1,2-dioxygenase [Gammaproteobacteria bacterium]|nr:homogentisate 1,2-dioxygenase [Gammaproteobacteria bacterium]